MKAYDPLTLFCAGMLVGYGVFVVVILGVYVRNKIRDRRN